MKKRMERTWFAAIAIAIVLLAGALQPAHAGSSPLTRDQDPVVLTGNEIPSLVGTAVDRIVGFRRDGGGWTQIPVQIDERELLDLSQVYDAAPVGVEGLVYTDAGTYIGADSDPAFDADDEVCFMAFDAGPMAAAPVDYPTGVVAAGGVELQVHDPLDGGLGYVYLFESDGSLVPDAGQNYVTYTFDLLAGSYIPNYDTSSGPNPEASFAETPHYRTEFTDRWIRDVVRITTGGSTGVDILDRNKPIFAPGLCNRTEETFSNGGGAFFANKDGAIRGIRAYIGANSGPLTQRTHWFYDRRQDVRTNLRVHSIPSVATLYDYSPDAVGMTYRNSLETAGVPVDGMPDTVATGTLEWEMVSGAQGSLVSSHLYETDIPGFAPNSYYSDDSATSVIQCTGDAFEYATSGPFLDGRVPNTDPRLGDFRSLTLDRILTYDAPGLAAADAQLRYDRASTPLGVDVFDFEPVEGSLTVLLTPQSTTVSPGERLFYDVRVENGTDSTRTFDFWVDVVRPNGSPYPGNPVLGPRSVTLRSGRVATRTVSLRIPAGVSPSGPYTVRGTVGTFPDGVEDQSTFEFSIVE